MELLCIQPVFVNMPLLFYLDFETTGLSVTNDFIVEAGLLEHASHAKFSSVVCPPVFSSGPNIHGIEDSELREGPAFGEVFHRMCRFVEKFEECVLEDDDSSSDELGPQILKESPEIVIIAHNGIKFDFPVLLIYPDASCDLPGHT